MLERQSAKSIYQEMVRNKELLNVAPKTELISKRLSANCQKSEGLSDDFFREFFNHKSPKNYGNAKDKLNETREFLKSMRIPKFCDGDAQVSCLDELHKVFGMGVSIRSALLTWCYPDSFLILDSRVAEEMKFSNILNTIGRSNSSYRLTLKLYNELLGLDRNITKPLKLSPMRIDAYFFIRGDARRLKLLKV